MFEMKRLDNRRHVQWELTEHGMNKRGLFDRRWLLGEEAVYTEATFSRGNCMTRGEIFEWKWCDRRRTRTTVKGTRRRDRVRNKAAWPDVSCWLEGNSIFKVSDEEDVTCSNNYFLFTVGNPEGASVQSKPLFHHWLFYSKYTAFPFSTKFTGQSSQVMGDFTNLRLRSR